uniref:Photosystem II reaction center protein Z n=1 Tax=Palisada sp. TaxID=1955416 RepID=A0A1Z1MRM1_9FLOR|nr:photosystem II protein Z [Palisada intermedia]ARW68743.1 photosystem II protein Z [Palisada sp.]WKW95776.1 photosystem II protein Z [Palisada intermedia]
MTIVVQLLVLAFVVLSTILVVGIPVTLASPGQWEKSKNLIYTSIGIWVGLVLVTGILNSFVA